MIDSVVETVLDAVAGLAGPLLYIVTAALAFSETAVFLDLVVPGEVGMVIAGTAGHRGGASLATLVVSGAVGATLGDSVSYAVARRYGLRIVDRWDFTRRRLRPSAERAQRYFEERGGWAVFAARFVGALRAVVPVVAGTGRMPYPRFLAWNAAASLLWAAAVVSAGYYLGRHVADLLEEVGGWVSLGVVALLVVVWLVVRRTRGDESPDEA